MKQPRRSSAYDENKIEDYIFVHGGSAQFIAMLPTDKVEEAGPEKVLVRDGEIVAVLVKHGLWSRTTQYKVVDNKEKNRTEVWARIS